MCDTNILKEKIVREEIVFLFYMGKQCLTRFHWRHFAQKPEPDPWTGVPWQSWSLGLHCPCLFSHTKRTIPRDRSWVCARNFISVSILLEQRSCRWGTRLQVLLHRRESGFRWLLVVGCDTHGPTGGRLPYPSPSLHTADGCDIC